MAHTAPRPYLARDAKTRPEPGSQAAVSADSSTGQFPVPPGDGRSGDRHAPPPACSSSPSSPGPDRRRRRSCAAATWRRPRAWRTSRWCGERLRVALGAGPRRAPAPGAESTTVQQVTPSDRRQRRARGRAGAPPAGACPPPSSDASARCPSPRPRPSLLGGSAPTASAKPTKMTRAPLATKAPKKHDRRRGPGRTCRTVARADPTDHPVASADRACS